MKPILFTLAAGLLLATPKLGAESLLKPNDIVAICGDSITEQKLYSVFLEDYFLMCQPVTGVQTIQFGISGTGAKNLGDRTENNLSLFHPSVATVLYGMNDGEYKPLNDERAKAFRDNLTYSIQATKNIGVRSIIVGSPTCVDWTSTPDRTKMYNETLASLTNIAREVAAQQGVVFTDIHSTMRDVIAKARAVDPSFTIGGDGTHPGQIGHLMIAYGFLKGIGCDGAIGTITVDLSTNSATGSPGQKALSVKDGVIEIESTRYPYCFTAGAFNDDAPGLKFLPFNEELNRYLLVVHGLKTPMAKVTWGAQSREFATADLEKGVNLATSFIPNNPFSEAFARVDDTVCKQQAQASELGRFFLPFVPCFKTTIPSETETIDQIVKGGIDQQQALSQAAAALVVPVRHTIRIEPLATATSR